jgi:hypothetical protein
MTQTQQQAAALLVDRTFQLMCFEKSSFTSEDIRQACMDLIDKEIEKTQFITNLIGE